MPVYVRYTIGACAVDAAHRTVSAGEQTHSLSPKEFELLELLVDRRGEVVSKEEIFAALWADVQVTEGNLTQHVYRLRSVLGNEAIRTVPKRGYELVAPVEKAAGGEAAAAEQAEMEEPAPVPMVLWKRRRLWAAGAGLLLVATLAAFGTRPSRTDPAAYDFYLRGQARQALSRRDQKDIRPGDERQAAIALFRRAIEADPGYADAYGALAGSLCESNRVGFEGDRLLAEARSHARTALRMDKRNLKAREALICVAHAGGRQEDALRIAVELEGMGRPSATASFAAGNAFFRAGLLDRALPLLQQAVQQEPTDMEYRYQLAFALMLAGDPQSCLGVISPSLRSGRGGYWYATNCLKELGRTSEAIEYGAKLVNMEPESPTAYRALAISYLQAGKKTEAKQVLRQAVDHFEGRFEISPNARSASFLALLHAHLRNRQETVKWIEKAIRMSPGNSFMHYQGVVAYGILGDDGKALGILERAIEGGFTLKYYLDWQIQPEMDVPTLTQNARYQELLARLGRRVAELDASLRVR